MRRAAECVEMSALTSAVMFLHALPMRLATDVACWAGRAVCRITGTHRRRAEDNLRHAFPGATEAWRRRVAQESFEHLARVAVETLKFPRAISPERFRDYCDVPDEARALDLLKAGRGAIFCGGHLGNWELAARWAAVRGLRLTSVAHELENRLVSRLMNRERAARGNTAVPLDGALRNMTRALRRGDPVALLMDRNPRDNGILVPFFGRPALTLTAPALLASLTGAPIIPFGCVRDPHGSRYTLHYGEALFADLDASRPQEIERLTRACSAALEGFIRLAPGQWQWMHRRWKVTPGGLLRAGITADPASAPHRPEPSTAHRT